MNPFLQMVRNNPVNQTSNSGTPNVWAQKIEDLKNGKADPKQVALEFVQKLNPKQKALLKLSLPVLQNFAKQNGASDENINSFLTEVKAVL